MLVLLELLGLAAITAGATLIFVPAGLIVGGVLAVAITIAADLGSRSKPEPEQ